ncbi:diguanylate cyclase [Magnetofaba australis]|nr:diguanylate cyclase [Magnetofaba australis]
MFFLGFANSDAIFAQTSEPDLETVQLRLQWKHQFEFAGFYAAKEKGFYREAGLDVDILEFDGGVETVGEVLAAEGRYAVGYSSLVNDYLSGKPVVLLANILKRSPVAIVAQPQIRSPRDLVGKRVMGVAETISTLALSMMLERFGVPFDTIQLVPPTYRVDEFVRGDVDAMVVFTSNEIFDLDRAGKRYTLLNPSVYGAEYYDVNLFTSRKELDHHFSRAQRFRQASLRGWEYALQNESEIIELILNKYNSQHKSRESLLFEAAQIRSAMMPKVHPIGSFTEQRLQMIAGDLVQLGRVPADTPLNFESFIFQEPRQELKLTERERRYLAERKSITYCADPDWMPFEKIENGVHKGMSAEFFKLFEQKLNIPLKLTPTRSWSESLTFAKQRHCDLFSLAMPTPERQVYMNFTPPYIRYPLVIATRSDTMFILELESVMDRPLGIVRGYAFVELLKRKYPGINLVEVETLADGLEMVANGELFGFIDSLGAAGYQIQRRHIGELKIAGKFDENWELGIGVRNDDPILLGILSKVVATITPDERRDIESHWFSISYQQGLDYRLFMQIMAVALAIGLMLLYHLFTQRSAMRKLRAAHAEVREKSKELESLSITDKLTGLNNRLKLDEDLGRYADHFSRYGNIYSVMLLDIDYFKKVNDVFGHMEGDRVLKDAASLLTHCLRKSDIIGRWGGEEFLIICPGTALNECMSLAEKLRQRFQQHDFGLGAPQSISLGVAQCEQGVGSDDLLSAADAALYRAKQGGRNRACAASVSL